MIFCYLSTMCKYGIVYKLLKLPRRNASLWWVFLSVLSGLYFIFLNYECILWLYPNVICRQNILHIFTVYWQLKWKTRKHPSVRKRMDRLAKAPFSPLSKHRHINSIFTVNTPILFKSVSFSINSFFNIENECKCICCTWEELHNRISPYINIAWGNIVR
jgi:hypothetical protein